MRRFLLGVAGLGSFSLALLAALTGACGGPEDGSCEAFWAVFCEREAECAPAAFALIWGEDVDTCATRYALVCDTWRTLPDTNFEGSALAKCVDDLADVSCDAWLDVDYATESCQVAVRGKLEGHEPCVDSLQCQSGTCQQADLFMCGQCAPLKAEGQKCTIPTDICDVGLFCSPMGAPMKGPMKKPTNGTCQPFATAYDPCMGSAECEPGLFCDGTACVPVLDTGDPCTSPAQCNEAAGYTCTGSCKPASSTYWGGECDESIPCRAGFYCDGKYGTHGRCVAVKADGELCDTFAFQNECWPPARCVTGKCLVPKPQTCP